MSRRQAQIIAEQAQTIDTAYALIGKQNELIQILREDNNYLAAQMVADHAEYVMRRADCGRCLHPSREDDQK